MILLFLPYTKEDICVRLKDWPGVTKIILVQRPSLDVKAFNLIDLLVHGLHFFLN